MGDSLAGTGVTINLGGRSMDCSRVKPIGTITSGHTYGLEIKQLIGKSDGTTSPVPGKLSDCGCPGAAQSNPSEWRIHVAGGGGENTVYPPNPAIWDRLNASLRVMSSFLETSILEQRLLQLGILSFSEPCAALHMLAHWAYISSVIIASESCTHPVENRTFHFPSAPSNQRTRGNKVEFARIRDNACRSC